MPPPRVTGLARLRQPPTSSTEARNPTERRFFSSPVCSSPSWETGLSMRAHSLRFGARQRYADHWTRAARRRRRDASTAFAGGDRDSNYGRSVVSADAWHGWRRADSARGPRFHRGRRESEFWLRDRKSRGAVLERPGRDVRARSFLLRQLASLDQQLFCAHDRAGAVQGAIWRPAH